MNRTQPSKSHVRVIFPLEQDEDGFPPEDREGVWAVPLGGGIYRIDNIPFFAMMVSDGDIVSVQKVGDSLIFDKVITPSDNCTIRIVFYDLAVEELMRAELKDMDCSIEGTGVEGLISVSVHKDSYPVVQSYLDNAFNKDILDYQEASLR